MPSAYRKDSTGFWHNFSEKGPVTPGRVTVLVISMRELTIGKVWVVQHVHMYKINKLHTCNSSPSIICCESSIMLF